jgi:hypothetical protein
MQGSLGCGGTLPTLEPEGVEGSSTPLGVRNFDRQLQPIPPLLPRR